MQPNNIIELCSKFMLTHENMQLIIPQSNNNIIEQKNYTKVKPINRSLNNIKDDKSDYYIPHGCDKLFWCFYKLVTPEWDHNNCNFKLEKDFKISCIEKLRMIKPELKIYKITLSHVENDLLNEKKIGLQTLLALCVLYKINLLYTWNHKYIEINSESIENTVVYIINNINNVDCLPLNEDDTKVGYYRENYLYIANPNKPIKAVSAYNIKELTLIAKKLEINTNNLTNKKDIYEKILEKI